MKIRHLIPAGSVTGLAVFVAMVAAVAVPAFGATITAPNLGTASSFGLLAGTVSNTGLSIVQGNVGAMTSITGFSGGPGISTTGNYYTPAGPIVTQAFNDVFVGSPSVYDYFLSDATTPSTQTVVGGGAGLTTDQTFLSNNVYSFGTGGTGVNDVTSAAGHTLTFDGSGVFILKGINDLTINGPITFDLINGALASNIYWIIGITATINPTVPIIWDGSILAGTSFTMSGATSGQFSGTINGCVFARTGTATLAAATDINGCASGVVSGVPEPGSAGLAGLGCLFGALCMMRRYRSVRQTR